MNLGTAQLKAAIRDLLREKGYDGSVVDKVNAHGEIVIAVVLNERCPACNGTGKKVYSAERIHDTDQDVGR